MNSRNIKHFESLDYIIPRWIDNRGREKVRKDTKIIVRVNDLLDGSSAKVDIQCDGCEEVLIGIRWYNYKRYVRSNGKYYCKNCAHKLFGGEAYRQNKLKNGISFKQWCYDNLLKEDADKLISRWVDDLNIDKNGNILTPKDVTYSSVGINGKGYWFKCLDYLEHKPEQKRISDLTVSKCKGNIKCNQCNTIAITHPYLVKYLKNKEDAYKYSHGSNTKIPMVCPDCGYEKSMSINTLLSTGLGCPSCSDGVSYPEKFLLCAFKQLKTIDDLITQLSKTTFKWCGKYLYDFYINNIKSIIETGGMQHYKENKIWNMSLKETQENDKQKELLAKKNGIENYIVIDCRYSDMDFIKKNIMNSELPQLLNFKESDIVWLKCHEAGCSSLVKIASELWNSGIKNAPKIAIELKIDRHTARKYLKQGVKLGWCDYDSKEAMKNSFILMSKENGRKVICLTTGEVFDNSVKASKKYNLKNSSSIYHCCKHICKSAGKLSNGIKLVWMYYDEYIANNKDLKWYNNIQDSKYRKIICLTTMKVFNTVLEVQKEYNIKNNSGIYSCCEKKRKSGGKLPDGTKLIFMYYNEYLEIQNQEPLPL